MLSHIGAQLPRFLTWYNALFLVQAAGTTLALSAVGSIVGTFLGSAIAVLRRTRSRWLLALRVLGILYVELFRRIPFLVTLLVVFYATQLAGFEVPLFLIALIAVCLIATAYLAEIVRAALASVHPNQWDSAAVANFSLWQTLWQVAIPQAWPVALPPAFGFFVMFLKDTALASQIGLVELTYAGKMLNNRGFAPALTFGAVLLLYFALSYPLARLGRHLEVRLARPRHH
jgi:polar amino acid transport system permease protein